jgi:hypothetical protein
MRSTSSAATLARDHVDDVHHADGHRAGLVEHDRVDGSVFSSTSGPG